jgi:hypothetical protein
MVIYYYIHINKYIYQNNPITGLDGPRGFQDAEATRFQNNRHMKVVRLSALRTGRLYTPGFFPGTHFCQRLGRPQCHSAAGEIMSMKNSNDTIENRTRALPTCNTVPQPTALRHVCRSAVGWGTVLQYIYIYIYCIENSLGTVKQNINSQIRLQKNSSLKFLKTRRPSFKQRFYT